MSSVPKLSHYISKFALCQLWNKKGCYALQNISQELWMLKLEELFCVNCCKKLRFAVIEFFWGVFFEFLIDLIVLYFGVYAHVCVHVCVFFSGAVTMPWFSDFRCWFTQRNRRPIPQIWILSSGLLCSHGGCKFKSPSQYKKMSRFLFFFSLHVCTTV